MGNFSWQHLLQQRQPCLSIDAAEVRCLSYYHKVVAPSLARSLDVTFWAIHVPKVLDQEPAARHAVLAISALHEDFDATTLNRALGRLDELTHHTTRLEVNAGISYRYAFALQHYNTAIRMILEDRIRNAEVLLTVSLLFTCIELLQGSAGAAFKHCQYGVSLYHNGRLSPELSAAFDHLSSFPQLVETLTLPEFSHPQGKPCSPTIGEMHTVVQARQMLEATMARGARLLRLARGGREYNAYFSAQDLEIEQFHVLRTLGLWWKEFAALRWRLSFMSPANELDAASLRLLETRWLVSNILASTCLAGTVDAFDEYLDQFQLIVETAEHEQTARNASGLRLPGFSFDLGYLPLLYIVAIHCRNLRLRVRALVLLKDLSCARETIWDATILYATARRVIELEHGLLLNEERMMGTTNPYPEEQPPNRILSFDNTNEAILDVDSEGHKVVHRRICFDLRGPDGVVESLWDYTTLRI